MCPHWSWPECREAFGWDLDEWLFYGGYPGAARLVRSHARWSAYVADSLIESVLSRDVLQLATVAKHILKESARSGLLPKRRARPGLSSMASLPCGVE